MAAMARIRVTKEGWGAFECPGCKSTHRLRVKLDDDGSHHPEWVEYPIWNWNGDLDRPTLSPSIRYPNQCHMMIEAGVIWFYQDSQHELAGQVVEMPELT